MNRKVKTDNLPVEDSENSWLGNNLHRLMIGVSVVWFAIVLIYITQFFGWSNMFLMMPDEFGGFLACVTLPLAIIWVVMAYIDRGSSFKKEAKFLRAYMNQLVYPEEGGATTAKAMADAIRSQVVELQEVTKLAMSQTEKIKQELGSRVDDFANLVKVLDNYSTKSIVELTNGVKTLTQSFDGVTDRAFQTTKDLNACMNEFSQVAARLQGDISGIISNLIPGVQEMKQSADTIQSVAESSTQRILEANENLKNYSSLSEENFNMVIEKMQGQGQYLEDISEKAINSSQNVAEKIRTITLDIDELLKSQTEQVNEYADALDANIREIYKKFAEHGDALEAEVDKIISRSNVIEESISIQVNELKNVAENINESLGTVETTLGEQFQNLDNRSTEAVGSLQKVIDAVEDKTEQMLALTDSTSSRATACGDNIELQHNRIKEFTAALFENIDALNERLDDNMNKIKQTSDAAMEQFNAMKAAIDEQAEKLNESSTFAVTQSKVAETSLSQQNRHINNSISKIEETKSELKRQIDELSHAASLITEEANEAVEQLKEQLAASVKVSTDVVAKTGDINQSLEDQAKRFDETTDKTLEKVARLEEIITSQNAKFASLSASIDERAEQVAATLSKHAAMVEEATGNSGNTFNEILSAFETQSALLNSVAENTVGYVSDVVRALDEKAENINLLFKHQQDEFFDVCGKISENTESIGQNLQAQIAAIEDSADKVFAKMSGLEEEVDKRAVAVVDKSEQSIEKLGEIDAAIAERSQKLENNIGEISAKTAKLTSEFALSVNSFAGILKDMKTNTDTTTTAILSNADRIKVANTGFNKDVKELVGEIDIHIGNVGEAVAKLQAQAAEMNTAFDTQKENLLDVVNTVTAQTRLGEAAMAKHYQYLNETAAEVAAKMQEICSGFKTDIDGMFESAGKLSFEVNALGDRLLKVGGDIDKASGNSVKSIQKVNNSLEQCTQELVSATDNAAAKMDKIMRDYEQYLAGFNTVTAEASSGVVEINDLISAQNEKMVHISEDTKKLVDYFNTLLNDTTKKLTEKANEAHGKVKALGEDLKSLSLELEDAANLSSQHFEKSGDKLRSTIMEISANAERIAGEIKSSGEEFLKQSDHMVASADETLSKVNSVMGTMRGSLDDFTNKSSEIVINTNNFNGVIQKQIELLDIGAKQASKELLDIEKRYREVKVENFLKNATNIIERLETLAIDINSIFNPEVQEKLWHKYYEGETDAFVRYLAKGMTRKQVVAVKEEFEKNAEFRRVVSSYISEFEELIAKARGCEKSEILLSVISGADIGKIYYILARALDKVN